MHGWVDEPDIKFIDVLDPRLKEPIEHLKVTNHQSASTLGDKIGAADIVVLAVKPQIMDKACEQIKEALSENTLILSIAAGQTIESFEQRFGENQPIIRAMPNTPAAIGKGITVLCANNHVSDEQKKNAETLLAASGLVEWLNDESLMDAVTAVSGSGPAYVFLLIEILAKAGKTQGLDPDLSMKLARQTVIGSAALAEGDVGTTATQLRENVTSPGGTTAAALEVLMNGELQKLYDRTIDAATKRGKELSS